MHDTPKLDQKHRMMSKALLVDSVAEKLGSSRTEAVGAIDAVLTSIGKVAVDGGR